MKPMEPSIPQTIREPHRTALQAAARGWVEMLGPRLVSLVLLGSVARGDARSDSDIDLLIVAEDLPSRPGDRIACLLRQWREIRTSAGIPPVEWNLVVKTPEEAVHRSPLYLDMTVEAVFLLDQGDFFRTILDGMKARMKELGSRRKFLTDGSWYWDLKPDFHWGEDVEI